MAKLLLNSHKILNLCHNIRKRFVLQPRLHIMEQVILLSNVFLNMIFFTQNTPIIFSFSIQLE